MKAFIIHVLSNKTTKWVEKEYARNIEEAKIHFYETHNETDRIAEIHEIRTLLFSF